MSPTFVAPSALADVLAALASGAVPLAGGTDLVVGHRQGKRLLPDALVNLDLIAELRGITRTASGGLMVGALTNHQSLVEHVDVRTLFTGLADASAIVGSAATRSTGTLGGNVMNASPAADTTAPLLCMGAVAVLQSVGGTRRVSLADLFVGPGRTSAQPGELLVAVELPAPVAASTETSGSSYVRLEYRRHMEIAVVGAAAFVSLNANGQVVQARVAMTALAPTVRLVPDAAVALVGTDADGAAIAAAGAAVAQAASPISDVRGSADYRRAMAAVIARRAIVTAVARARGADVRIPASDSTFASLGTSTGVTA